MTELVAMGSSTKTIEAYNILEAGRPLTQTLLPRIDAIAEGIESKIGTTAVRIVIRGVEILSGRSLGIRVFLNKADADEKTPTFDPHYVTSVALFPAAPGEGPAGGGNFSIDVTEQLRALIEAKKLSIHEPLLVTLVLDPSDKEEAVVSRLKIGSITLELGQKKV